MHTYSWHNKDGFKKLKSLEAATHKQKLGNILKLLYQITDTI
jgi:hypothetical protein